jgi:hypothetical protein
MTVGKDFDDRDAVADQPPTERDRELSELVDDLEELVAAEHEAQAVPGNAAERAHTTPTDTGDDAPD